MEVTMSKHYIQHRLKVLHELIRGLMLNEETVPQAIIDKKNQPLKAFRAME